jgi:hypothetical protein
MSLGATMSAPAFASDAAVAVRGVLAEADIGHHYQRIELSILLEGAQCRLHDAVFGPRARGLLVLLGRKTE